MFHAPKKAVGLFNRTEDNTLGKLRNRSKSKFRTKGTSAGKRRNKSSMIVRAHPKRARKGRSSSSKHIPRVTRGYKGSTTMFRTMEQKHYFNNSVDVGDRLWKRAKIRDHNRKLKLLDEEAMLK